VVDLTLEERIEHYLVCLDLVEQLPAYVKRNLAEKPDVTLSESLDNLVGRIPLQGWYFGIPDFEWIPKHLRGRFVLRSKSALTFGCPY
jgi:hypothetical protein